MPAPSVTGDIIVSFDGDDVSERSRIRRISDVFQGTPAQLVDPSLARRTSALLRLAWAGAYREELLQHVGLALAPECYLRYKRRAFGVAAEGG